LDAGQRADDVFDHAVGEIVLARIAAQIQERQDGDRRPVGDGGEVRMRRARIVRLRAR
jgi:hypothetical protein